MRAGVTKGAVLVLLAAAMALSGCTNKRQKGVTFEGIQFRSDVAQVGENLEEFQVTVFKVSQSLEGAREAGRWEATRYCIRNFGASDKEWIVGPDAEDGQLVVRDDTLTFRGRCKGW